MLEPLPDVSIHRLGLCATAVGPVAIFWLLCNVDSQTGLGELTLLMKIETSPRIPPSKS